MVREFTDLQVWQESHKVVLGIYKITDVFPKKEHYGLASQMQRAAVSITSNIAEGFGRYNFKEKVRFYYMSQGSMSELKNQLIIARDLGYIEEQIYERLIEQLGLVTKLLKGLIKATKGLVPTE